MKRSAGFTLIEMLLASALTAVLMVGVMAVVGQLGSPLGDSSQPSQAKWEDAGRSWQSLLRQELALASTVDGSVPGQIELRGPLALSLDTLERTHDTAVVRYFVETIAGTSALWREQSTQPLGVDQTKQTQRWLVGLGVERFEFAPPQPPTHQQANRNAQPGDDDTHATAMAWTLKVWFQSADTQGESQLMPVQWTFATEGVWGEDG